MSITCVHFRDYTRTDSSLLNYRALLCQLSNSIDADIDVQILRAKLNKILSDEHYHTYLALDGQQIVGTVTLLLEETFLHNCSLNGHLENIVVDNTYRGQGISGLLIELAIQKAKQSGAYKLILDCVPEIQHVYDKHGFQIKAVQMRIDFDH